MAVVGEHFLTRVLSSFPTGIELAFAYGSGVLRQTNPAKKNVIDFVFSVNNASKWHEENLAVNRSHYSALKFGGPAFVSKVQEEFGAGVYFNTLIPFDDQVIKYGVISTDKLITDLLDWDTLYISGRLHKPVKMLHMSRSTPNLKSALMVNLSSAAHAALLLLPEQFTEEDLFTQIAGLSYTGDFRMYLGEDRDKIKNIVESQMESFQELYRDTVKSMQHLHFSPGKLLFEQDLSANSRIYHLNLLPKVLQFSLYRLWHQGGHSLDIEDVLKAIADDIDCEEIVSKGVKNIVLISSWSQSLKGILTAGFLKSVKYGAAKVSKMVRSWGR